MSAQTLQAWPRHERLERMGTDTSNWATNRHITFIIMTTLATVTLVRFPVTVTERSFEYLLPVERSGNFGSVYQGLEKHMVEKKQWGCPTSVALGDNGRYFFRSSWGAFYRLSQDVVSALGNMSEVNRLWLGKNEAYVAEKSDGSILWGLKGQYIGLAEHIKANYITGEGIKVCHSSMQLQEAS